MTLTNFNNLYSYKYDPEGRDVWRVLKLNELGEYRGNCEDYSLSILCGCDTNGGGHVVLRYGDQYIDNWTKEWVDREHMEGLGHEFWPWYKTILPTTVAIKMMMAKLRG